MTFSIAAVDVEANEVGVAVQSKFLAAGAIVPWARGGVGAVATQALADVTFGPRGLDLLAEGLEPEAVVDRLLEGDPQREQRQVGVVDAAGRVATFTGAECFEWAGGLSGPGFACQGNILASAEVVAAMAEAFQAAAGPLAERLVQALRAGQRAGGDRRGQEAAGLVVACPGGGYGGNHDRYIDLRVDHHDQPIEELARLLDLHHLYFERPREVLEADGEVEDEIRSNLERLARLHPGQDLWDALSDYMGWANLEERWVGRGRIDPRVLEYLRHDHDR
ncbi:MAG: DUF1028 domain-containing protein [Actinomycetota bacterium]|nr:DUF1028 domain-containing protein [Actinomycetota bacterium]